MANWLISRERMKRAAGIHGTDFNADVDPIIEGYSKLVERTALRFFIPRLETRLYDWPQPFGPGGQVLELDQDLISVTTLQTKAQDSSPTTISSSDFFLYPSNTGPPFNRIEMDKSSNAVFEAGDTPQRSISVEGKWGFTNDTRSAGTVDKTGGVASSSGSLICSDASLIDVGDTLLIETEQVFTTERVAAAEPNNDLLDDTLTADVSDVTVTVDDGSRYNASEVILIDSEKMFINSISSNNLSVIRAYDASVLASHANNAPVSVFRTFLIERGINGTTAANHVDTTAISKYEPSFDIAQLVLAESIAYYQQQRAGFGGSIGTAGASVEMSGVGVRFLQDWILSHQSRVRSTAI